MPPQPMIATLTFSFAPSTEPGTALKAAVEAAILWNCRRVKDLLMSGTVRHEGTI